MELGDGGEGGVSKQAAHGFPQGKQGPFACPELLPQAAHGASTACRAEGQPGTEQGRQVQCL